MGKLEGETADKGRSRARLRGARLAVARAAWIGVAAVSLGLFALSVPSGYALLRRVCAEGPCGPEQLRPDAANNLAELGVSLELYAAYQTAVVAVFVLLFSAVAAVVFLRRSDDGMALYTSLTLVLSGVFLPDWMELLVGVYPFLWLPLDLLNTITYSSLFVLFYIFPDGRFTPRWTRLPALGWIALLSLHYVVPGAPADWPPALLAVTFLVLAATCLFAQIYRYGRVSGPVERQQTKWVVFGLVVMIFILLLVTVPPTFRPSLEEPGTPYDLGLDLGSFAAVLLVPLAFGFAILRYRLFDIDVIVNRALVYTVLTTSLLLIYLGGVVGLQYVIRALGGGESSLDIVASTLAIAALFVPLRRRIQSLIDRAFYRRKYDAGRVLGSYAARLREGTDLDALGGDLSGVIRETMRPAHVSLWLREPERAEEHPAGPEGFPRKGGRP